MLSSLDGKISTGATDNLDVDRDFPTVKGLREGLRQYYEIEQTTELWSLNSGRVQAKLGVNEKPLPAKTPVSFALIDNTHLTEHGVAYFCARAKACALITSNADHPAFRVKRDNLTVLYQETPDLRGALTALRGRCGCERLTVQTGGTLNALLVRAGLIDYVDIVIAPVLIGGRDTPTLVDGESLTSADELGKLCVLTLESAETLEGSYLRLRYRVRKLT